MTAASTNEYVDTSAHIISILGESASLAAKFGPPALDIISFIAAFYPPAEVVVAALTTAAPIIKAIAANAPAISNGLKNSKPLINAIVDVGDVALQPLHDLFKLAYGKAAQNEQELASFLSAGPLGNIVRQSYFTPQDPRFDLFNSSDY